MLERSSIRPFLYSFTPPWLFSFFIAGPQPSSTSSLTSPLTQFSLNVLFSHCRQSQHCLIRRSTPLSYDYWRRVKGLSQLWLRRKGQWQLCLQAKKMSLWQRLKCHVEEKVHPKCKDRRYLLCPMLMDSRVKFLGPQIKNLFWKNKK